MGGKNTDIEVLRAVAVLFVVVHHLPELFVWDGAWQKLFVVTTFWSGVDLFFCVSGFVIASSLLREGRASHFLDLAIPFWIRRVWRIWPAALTWLAIGILASRFFNQSGALGTFTANVADGIAAVLQVANFHFMNCWNYNQGACGIEAIYWSLSLEEQFYFLFPFALFFLPRRWLRLGLIGVIALQFFWDRPVGSPLWLIRTDAICYGVLIAMAMQSPLRTRLYPSFMKKRSGAIVVSAVGFFLLSAIPTHQVVWFDTGLLALLCAGLVYIASYDDQLIVPVPYLRPVLLWIGSRSFAIYLTHFLSYLLTREIFFRLYPGTTFDASFALPFALTAATLIVVLSECTYRFIEQPFRQHGRAIAERYRHTPQPMPPPSASHPSASSPNPSMPLPY